MTLKEKFYPYCDNEYSEKWASAENCEDVADEFAIGFAEWLNVNAYKYPTKITTKELLKIYKQQIK